MTMLFGVELFVDEQKEARRAGDTRGREGKRGVSVHGQLRRKTKAKQTARRRLFCHRRRLKRVH